MTNEQYNAKCEAIQKFRSTIVESEKNQSADYIQYAAYYIIKHGLYRDASLMKDFLNDQQTKTYKLKLRVGDEYRRIFYGYWRYNSFSSDKKEWKYSHIINYVLEYVPEEFKDVVMQFDKEYV